MNGDTITRSKRLSIIQSIRRSRPIDDLNLLESLGVVLVVIMLVAIVYFAMSIQLGLQLL